MITKIYLLPNIPDDTIFGKSDISNLVRTIPSDQNGTISFKAGVSLGPLHQNLRTMILIRIVRILSDISFSFVPSESVSG